MAPLGHVVIVLLGVGAMAYDEERARALSDAIRRALGKRGRTMLRASQEAERHQSQITREVACTEGLGYTLASQGEKGDRTFLRDFALELACAVGVPRDIRIGERLRRIRAHRFNEREKEIA